MASHLKMILSRSRGRYIPKLNVSKKNKVLPLTEDEKKFLDSHFEDYEEILRIWIKQEKNKYDLSQTSKDFPMLTLPKIKSIDQKKKKVLYGTRLSYNKEEDPEDIIHIKQSHIIYSEWQKLINRIIIRLKNRF